MSDPPLRGILPIEKKFLQNNYLFALQYREGFLFGRTIRRRIMEYKPWPLIDANGSTVNIAASATQPELRFRDPRNVASDILYLDQTTSVGLPWFLHGAIGIKPQQINMYPRFPEGDIIPGKFPGIDPIRPAAGDNISPINGLVSPYESPTDFVEFVIPPLTHIGAEYYNKDTFRTFNPVLNLFFAVYWVQLFTPASHPDLVQGIATRRYPATYLTVGFGDVPQDVGPQTAKDWCVTPMRLEEAAVLGRY